MQDYLTLLHVLMEGSHKARYLEDGGLVVEGASGFESLLDFHTGVLMDLAVEDHEPTTDEILFIFIEVPDLLGLVAVAVP